ncbi:hypothetical protein [Chitinibacter sp. ZOR0017]|uniref:hypothetical protein n=1 Tax=Chitinibacter sp. ZOR0017 TaxID=1339254 RepID=UPI0006472174|nr:hypothetical protein [Chitinibacter sp. ZOR0017]
MLYFIDRIDFVGDAPECHFQDKGVRHSVRKGIAHIVRDENGQEFVAGPSCARRHTKDTNWGERVPDFTKGALMVPVEAHPGGGGGAAGPRADDDGEPLENVDDFAVAYLRLRFEKLAKMGFVGAAHAKLEPRYQEWLQHKTLSESARTHIKNIEKMEGQQYDTFRMARLQKCYAVAFLIQAALKNPIKDYDRKYLDSYNTWIKKNYMLTVPQMDTLRKIFANLKDPLFSRVQLTNF